MLLALALLIAGVHLYPSLQGWLPNLEELPDYRCSVADIRVTTPDRWVPADLLQRIIVEAELPKEVSLLDETLAERIATAFADNPWIEQVETVRISRQHGIEVLVTYRSPAVMVQVAGGLYPVDRHGVLLPPDDFTAADIASFPILRAVQQPPAGPAGSKWEQPVVQGGARLADALTPGGDLSRYWRAFGLQAIEPIPGEDTDRGVTNFALLTTSGSRILWGRPPGEDELEPSAEQKLARLESYFAAHAGPDGIPPRKQIDIRHFDTIEVISLDSADRGRPL